MANIKQIAVFKKPEGQTGEWKVYDVGTVAEAIGISPITGLSANNVQRALETLNTNLSSLTNNLDNKVSKTGNDTMSGSLSINHINDMPIISFKSGLSDATIGNTGISDTVSSGFAGLFFNDYNGVRVGRLETRIMGTGATNDNPKGQTYMSLSAIGGTTANKVTNQLVLRVDPNGTSKVNFSHPQAWRNGLGIVFENLSTATNSTAQEPIKFAMGGNSNEDRPYIRWTKKGTSEKHQLVLSSASKTIRYQKSNNKPNGDQNLTWSTVFEFNDNIGQIITQTAVDSSHNVTTVNVEHGIYTCFPQRVIIPSAGKYLLTIEGNFPNNSSGYRKIVASTKSVATGKTMEAIGGNICQKTYLPVSGDLALDRIVHIQNFAAPTTINLYLYHTAGNAAANATSHGTILNKCGGQIRAMRIR